MYGTLTYDGDGNLIAQLKLYADDREQPELARVTVAEQVGLLNEYGQDASFEELDDAAQREITVRLADVITNQINGFSFVKAFVNHSNGHHDLYTAVRLAIEPGGVYPGSPQFRVTV